MGIRSLFGAGGAKQKAALMQMFSSQGVSCNICGSDEFIEFRDRGPIQCFQCKSLERTRLLKLVLEKQGVLKAGHKVLHFAPDAGVGDWIRSVVGEEHYFPVDYSPERYPREFRVQKFDLISGAVALPSNHYDLILHSHVMEHLACNVTAILWHLHRAITPTGHHVFSVPILDGTYESDFGTKDDAERKRRFGQVDHVRNFGRDDIAMSLGMIFDFEKPDLVRDFGEETLRAHNIPEIDWRGYGGNSFFVLDKAALKLSANRYSVSSDLCF